MFKKKHPPIINKEDLMQAKLIFFRYGGNKFGMHRNDELEKYESFCITKEIETKWLELIYKDYAGKIENSSNVIDLISNISSLIDTGINELETINLIIYILNNKQLDSFSTLRICEETKKLIKSSKSNGNTALIKKEIIRNCDILLSKPITISNDHLSLSYMRDYDFSDENIKKRISSLLDLYKLK